MITSIIKALQNFVKADKTVLTATMVNAIVALAASFGLHLRGSAVGILTALVAAGLGYIVSVNVKLRLEHAKAVAAKPADEAKPAA